MARPGRRSTLAQDAIAAAWTPDGGGSNAGTAGHSSRFNAVPAFANPHSISKLIWENVIFEPSSSRIRQQVPLPLVRESSDTADAVDLSEWCWWNWLEHVSDLARSIHCAEHLKCSAPTNPLWLMVQRLETMVSDSPGYAGLITVK
eukprot:gene13299-1453_t